MKFFVDFIDNLLNDGLEYFGLYYSMYEGIVYDVEDPENCNRIRLVIPVIDKAVPLKTWAMPKHLFGGKDYGINMLPKKGDSVWVEFEYGRLKNPVWSHGYYAINEKPKEFLNSKVYGFKTPGGTYVTINDETNELSVAIKDGVKLIVKQDEYYIAKDDSKLQPLVLGNELKKQLEVEKARVTGLIDAIKNAPIAPGDGGASFKSSIVTSISLLEKPDYSDINSKIGKTE